MDRKDECHQILNWNITNRKITENCTNKCDPEISFPLILIPGWESKSWTISKWFLSHANSNAVLKIMCDELNQWF